MLLHRFKNQKSRRRQQGEIAHFVRPRSIALQRSLVGALAHELDCMRASVVAKAEMCNVSVRELLQLALGVDDASPNISSAFACEPFYRKPLVARMLAALLHNQELQDEFCEDVTAELGEVIVRVHQYCSASDDMNRQGRDNTRITTRRVELVYLYYHETVQQFSKSQEIVARLLTRALRAELEHQPEGLCECKSILLYM